jgi:23S rRNA (adenine2503-C2)-methyltransferase
LSADAVNLLGLSRPDLERVFVDMGEKPFRARQVMKWVYGRAVLEPALMTDLSLALRQQLAASARFDLPEIVARQDARDGVIKWRLAAGDGQVTEMVYIPEGRRGTLCVSSQVGCAMDCPFCATGRQGFNRNLTAAEIIGQVLLARSALSDAAHTAISNSVFMGMGEPLANFRNVVQAADVLLDDLGFGLSRRRVTVSTSGLVPQIRRLAGLSRVALAVSLHAPNDALRDVLVPINRRHPIRELLDACWDYAARTQAKAITFEYVMLNNINDTLGHASALAGLLRGRPAKVNLIPFNPFPGSGFSRSDDAAVDRFREVLLNAGVMTITRKTRGDDIAAACGQLAGRVRNRIRVPMGMKLQGTPC